jgi:TolB protein
MMLRWWFRANRCAFCRGPLPQATVRIGRRRLTDNAVWDYPRSWSADGRRLLIETVPRGGRTIAIALLDVEDGRVRCLTDGRFNDGDPAFSPDQRQIAFSSDRDGNREIYVVGVDGTGERHLTPGLSHAQHPSS